VNDYELLYQQPSPEDGILQGRYEFWFGPSDIGDVNTAEEYTSVSNQQQDEEFAGIVISLHVYPFVTSASKPTSEISDDSNGSVALTTEEILSEGDCGIQEIQQVRITQVLQRTNL
jgi:hypothetical protein